MAESQIPAFNIAGDTDKQIFFFFLLKLEPVITTLRANAILLYRRSTEWPQVAFVRDLSPNWFIGATLCLFTNCVCDVHQIG